MTRQDVIDGMGHGEILGRDPRREWKITQIMLLVDEYARTAAREAVDACMDVLIRGVREEQP